MIIIPAIDIRNNNAVRLKQGDYNQETIYATDPVTVAKSFEAKGAKRLHVVDLDGAKAGRPINRDTILKIAKETSMKIELGGGIRDEKTAQFYLDQGIDYVIVGSMAIDNPEALKRLVKHYKERIIVSLDAKDGYVATAGWINTSKVDSITLIQSLETMGVQTIVYTDIAKDGMMQGTNLAMYEAIQQKTSIQIIASGGVSSKSDVEALRRLNVYGAIIGKALYEDSIKLEEVL